MNDSTPRGFGDEVRAILASQRVSVRALARRTNYDHAYLSRVLAGKQRPSRDMVEAIDAQLGAEGQLTALSSSHTPDTEERLVKATNVPRRLDVSAVESLANILTQQRRLEDAIGSAPLLEPVKSQLATVSELVSGARGSIRNSIVDVASQWAQFAGWLHTSSKSDDHGFYDQALSLAMECGNDAMVSTALNMKSHKEWVRGNPAPIVGLSQAAQRHGTPGVRAMAAQQEARGHALANDADETERCLDNAESLIEQAIEHPESEPPWVYFYSLDYLQMQRARAYMYLGYHESAAHLLSTSLDALPDEQKHTEWTAWYKVDLAKLYRHLHATELAEKVLEEVQTVASTTQSSRLEHQAQHLKKAFGDW
ncbi:helix-turn-helix protein [Haloactinospora alba]|uniref:Helix-turn-helix protein n=1 Tax=Haloactinospora alba TaxID=405555 RepID=A0A543NLG1_9ACTN|nr:helix-turn-helix transcriptional regulator [Haloactinospora alba]TQN32652.1 helix-turn-helix protein [Haloactinospora alba]